MSAALQKERRFLPFYSLGRTGDTDHGGWRRELSGFQDAALLTEQKSKERTSFERTLRWKGVFLILQDS
jgi:hypothetical protein